MSGGLMIERLMIQDFGCIKNRIDVTLSALHAFIGQTDTGKSTILRAAHALGYCGWTDNAFQYWNVGDYLATLSNRGATRLMAVSSGYSYELSVADDRVNQYVWRGLPGERMVEPADDAHLVCTSNQIGNPRRRLSGLDDTTFSGHSGVRLIRLEPDALRRPSRSIPPNDGIRFSSDRGEGLPGVYEAIQKRNSAAFLEIENHIRGLFENVDEIHIQEVSAGRRIMLIKLKDGAWVTGEHLSEGLLFYLALAALPYFDRTSLIILDEPENGLHPSKLPDVVQLLRRISERSQVLLATHSPELIADLAPKEVSVVTRSPTGGTSVTPIRETAYWEEREKMALLDEPQLDEPSFVRAGYNRRGAL